MSNNTNDSWGSLTPVRDNEQYVFDNPLNSLQSAKQGLSFLERLKLDWRSSKEISKHVEGIASSLMRQQRADLENQIMLNLDIKQKKRFVAYLSEVNVVDSAIFAATEDAKKYLIKYMVEQLKEMRTKKKSDIDEFNTLAKTGDILPEDAEFLINTVTELTESSSENIKQKFAMLIQQHSDNYKEILTNIRRKVIPDQW